MSTPCPVCGGALTAAGDCRTCQLALAWGDGDTDPAGEDAGLRRFGAYELLEVIGRGGMGTVYAARQHGSERVVALKMMHMQHLSDGEAQARFRGEIRHAAALTHPHILPLYEVGQHDGIPFFSMKHAENGSLAERLRAGPLDPRTAAELLTRLARAVHYAHQRGVLHRDLKPANILLDADDTPYVGDFGLARALDDAASLTASGVILGTPQFMAPEQAAGDGRAAGVASDVYGLGAILYAALTGRAPFSGDSPVATLRRVVDEAPPDFTALGVPMPRDLGVICFKALEKVPAGRYLSAAALADDLERWLGGQTILARPAGRGEQLWRWTRRNQALAAVSALLLVLLIAATLGSLLAARRLAVAERIARDELHRSQIAEARATRRSGRSGQRLQSLATLEKAARTRPTREVRDEVLAALAHEDVRVVSRRPIGASALPTLAFDPTLERYACQAAGGGLRLHATADGREIGAFRDAAGEPFVEINFGFSPDGRHLAARFLDTSTVVWEVATGRALFEWKGDPSYRPRVAFSPDSARVAYTPVEGGVYIFELARPEAPPLIVSTERFAVQGLAFAPDGMRLAFADDGRTVRERRGPPARAGKLRVIALADGHTLCEASQTAGWVALAWHPDGARLAAAIGRGDVVVLDTATGTEVQSLRGHRQEVIGLSYDRSGDRLITSSLDGTTRLWDAASGIERWSMPGVDPSFRVATTAERIGFNFDGNSAGILELIHSEVLRTLQPALPDGPPMGLDFSRDGRLLAVAGFGGVQVIDVATGRALSRLALKGQRRASAWFDPVADVLHASTLDEGLIDFSYQIGADGVRFADGLPRAVGAAKLLTGVSANGRLAGMASVGAGEGPEIVTLDGSRPVLKLDAPVGIGIVAFSPDNRFVARGTWQPKGVTVWDLSARRVVAEFEAGMQAFGVFSPDGRWLLTRSADAARFWRVADWSAGPVIPSEWREVPSAPADFSPRGGWLALIQGAERVQLIDAVSGLIRATLESPFALANNRVRFSPDGTLLAAVGENHAIQLWDLRVIRRELEARGLGWEMSPAPVSSSPPVSSNQ